jgi:hypothetical protein
MALMVRAIRLALRIARSEPLAGQLDLKPHSTDTADVFWPGDADPDVISDEEIAGFIRGHGQTNYHPVSRRVVLIVIVMRLTTHLSPPALACAHVGRHGENRRERAGRGG